MMCQGEEAEPRLRLEMEWVQTLHQTQTPHGPLQYWNAEGAGQQQVQLPQRRCACAIGKELTCKNATHDGTRVRSSCHAHALVAHKRLKRFLGDVLRQVPKMLFHLKHSSMVQWRLSREHAAAAPTAISSLCWPCGSSATA